jgi:hypothetical protein
MVTNQVFNEQKEANCIAITPERKYFHLKGRFREEKLAPQRIARKSTDW